MEINGHMPETLIIGTGPTGLGAALRLEQLGRHDWSLIEKEALPGGLSISPVDEQGFTWDLGVHVTFSHYRYFDQLLDEAVKDWNYHARDTWILVGDQWIPYPFQNNIHRLSKEDQKRCLQGLAERRDQTPTNFQQWIDYSFGDGIAGLFMSPYNAKVWAYPPKDLCVEWVGERVSTIDLPRILASIVDGTDAPDWGPNNRFRYPSKGGTGRIWSEAAARLPQEKIHYQCKVCKIDTNRRIVHTSHGSFAYQHLISTLPLNILLGMLDVLVETEAFEQPIHSSVHVVGLGVQGRPPQSVAGKTWIYFPDERVPFYRATIHSNLSLNNAPDGCWALLLEVSESPKRPLSGDPVLQSIEAALRLGMILTADSVVSRFHRRIEYAYPTPYLNRDAFLNKVQPQLAARGIFSRGRFGGWKYEVGNQDHSLMQGVEAADRVAFGVEENTYFYPDLVNLRKETIRSYSFASDRPLKSRLLENIQADLLPWRHQGVSADLFDKVRQSQWRGLHVKIINGQPEVFKEVPSSQTRNHCVILMLREVAARYRLPDCEFIIHTDDAPPTADLPMFAFCKRKGDKTILFPDFSFYSWLEVLLPNVDVAKDFVGRGHCSWEKKIDKAFFAGAANSPLRIQLGQMKHDFLDIRISDWTKSRMQFVPLDEHNRWKYLLHLSGNSWSARLKYLFFTNSMVIQGDNEWQEFWYPILEYGKDCIKYEHTGSASVDGLQSFLSGLTHEEAEQIVRRGHKKVSQALTLNNVYEYIARLITDYAGLLRYKVRSRNYIVVIARYNEDIRWSDGHPRIIYNKGKEIDGIPENEQIMLRNVGREAHTYLTYIIDHYDNLPDHVMFCQGRIDDHVGARGIDAYVNPDYDFIASGFCNVREWDATTGRLNHWGPWQERIQQGKLQSAELSYLEWFEKVLRVNLGESTLYTPGAIFCVAAKNIRRRHVKFYMKLRDYVSKHSEPEEAHYLERSWLYIFSDKNMKVLNLQ